MTAVTEAGTVSHDVVIEQVDASEVTDSIIPNTQVTATVTVVPISVKYDDDDLTATQGNVYAATIKLSGDTIAVDGSGVTVNGSTAIITSSGTYNISGILDDGQIIVDTEDEETVVLVLNGVDITCDASAPR